MNFSVILSVGLKTLGTFIEFWLVTKYKCPNFSTNKFSIQKAIFVYHLSKYKSIVQAMSYPLRSLIFM